MGNCTFNSFDVVDAVSADVEAIIATINDASEIHLVNLEGQIGILAFRR